MSKITTKTEVRLSYTNLVDPRARDDEHPDELVYSTAILIPKSDTDTVAALKSAIKEALAEGISKKWNGKTPKDLKNPLRDGDTKEAKDGGPDELYAGHWFINAKGPRGGQEKPILLNKSGQETDSNDIIYSGVFARVSLQFYAYDKNGNKGVAAGISAVLSQEHGDPLGGVATVSGARDEFGISTPAGDAAAEFSGSGKAAKSEPEAASADEDDDPWA